MFNMIFQFRRGTKLEWETENPILSDGEIAIEKDTNQFKIGNGVSNWLDLPYGGLEGKQGQAGSWDTMAW